MKKSITAATAIKKLRSNQLKENIENARGFSYSVKSDDPRASQINQDNKLIALDKVRTKLTKQNLSTQKIFDLAVELSLQNEILKLDNAELSGSIKLLTEANKLMQQADFDAAKVGGIGKSQKYEKNKRIAHQEYLRMSKNKKVSAAMLLNHLNKNFSPETIDGIQPWAMGTIKGWIRDFKK